MTRFIFALVLIVGVASCEGCQHNPAPTPVTPAGADAAPAKTPATCLDLCRHETDLNCAAAAPTPAGASCVDVCSNNQNAIAPWDLDCRTTAGSCAAIDRCP